MYRTHIFVVTDDGQIEPLPQPQYAKLLRGDIQLPRYANRAVRIADWFVEIKDDRPVGLINETYSLVHLDEHGRVRRRHERHGARVNRAFYDALANSAYPDADEDPAVQRLRGELQSEYAWRPSDQERRALFAIMFPE